MPPEQNCCIALCFNPTTNCRHYQNPAQDVQEIAIILPGDRETPAETQDIILYRKYGNGLQRIADNHPFYPSLHNVLFSTGQLRWHNNISYIKQNISQQFSKDSNNPNDSGEPEDSSKHVSLMEFFYYHFYIRTPDFESNHLFLSGPLFQEYICKCWVIVE